MPILITYTTEGFDREDGNVYYASHLVVDAPDAARPEVERVLRAVLQAGEDLTLDGGDDDAERRFEDQAAVIAALAAAGYPAAAVTPLFVTLDNTPG